MFTDVIHQLNDGAVVVELSERLSEVVAAVQVTGKSGALTLKLNVKPVTKGKDEVVFVADEVSVKVPQFDRPATIFFVTDQKQLVREDPRQMEFPVQPDRS